MSDNIPPEVITHILSQLPVKSLLRFRCVSKSFKALIDSPKFVKAHLNKQLTQKPNSDFKLIINIFKNSDSGFVFLDLSSVYNNSNLTLQELEFNPLDGQITVTGSCHGLVLMTNHLDENVVWNPCTNRFLKLPIYCIAPPVEQQGHQGQGLVKFVGGFGYDSVSDDYKVVRVMQWLKCSLVSETIVYSLKLGVWRKVQDCPNWLVAEIDGTLAGGVLHWIASRGPNGPLRFLGFNLGTERWEEVEYPENFGMPLKLNLAVLGGCLCLIEGKVRIDTNARNFVVDRVDVWVMKEYGVKESWVKLFSIDQLDGRNHFRCLRPVAYSETGSDVLLEMDKTRFLWYNIYKKSLKPVRISGEFDYYYFDTHVCLGTLVPVGNEKDSKKKKDAKTGDGDGGGKEKQEPETGDGAGNIMLDIPPEVITCILSRLPVKSLLRFRSVSKSFKSLIDSPKFIKTHVNQQLTQKPSSNLKLVLISNSVPQEFTTNLLSIDFSSVCNRNSTPQELHHPLKQLAHGGPTQLQGSCHGLVLISNHMDDNGVWNLSTREFRRLPIYCSEPPAEQQQQGHQGPGLAQFVGGFGYDGVSDDYKVVRIAQWLRGSIVTETVVYSLKSGVWKKVDQNCNNWLVAEDNGTFAGGVLHFIGSKGQNSPLILIGFNLGKERWEQVAYPENFGKPLLLNLAVLGGSLCLLDGKVRANTSARNCVLDRVDVWVMKEYGVKESWVKLFSIDQLDGRNYFTCVRPVAFSESGGEILLELDKRRFLWYNIAKKSLKPVRISGGLDPFVTHVCLETLVRLDGGGKKKDSKKKQELETRDGAEN